MKSLLKKIIVSFLVIMIIPIVAFSEEYDYIGDSDRNIALREDFAKMNIPYIIAKRSDGTTQVYCADYTKKVPKGIKYKKFEGGSKYDTEGVLAILDHGYPKNATNMQEKYGVSDDYALALTQNALWNYIEGWDKTQVDEPYSLELLRKAENKEYVKEEFKIDESKLYYKEASEFLETELINTSGPKGNFVIKTDEGTKAYDESGKERYSYEIGESFMLRNVSQKKSESSFNITANFNKEEVDIYVPEDDEYQNLIEISTNQKSLNYRYNINYSKGDSSIIQTGDKEIIYLLIMALGCITYIFLNIDLKKKCS